MGSSPSPLLRFFASFKGRAKAPARPTSRGDSISSYFPCAGCLLYSGSVPSNTLETHSEEPYVLHFLRCEVA